MVAVVNEKIVVSGQSSFDLAERDFFQPIDNDDETAVSVLFIQLATDVGNKVCYRFIELGRAPLRFPLNLFYCGRTSLYQGFDSGLGFGKKREPSTDAKVSRETSFHIRTLSFLRYHARQPFGRIIAEFVRNLQAERRAAQLLVN